MNDDLDLTAELDEAEEIVMGRADPEPQSEHVAICRMPIGGRPYEVITVSRAFLVGALLDARSWCSEMETPGASMPTSGKVADYDAALAVLEAGP